MPMATRRDSVLAFGLLLACAASVMGGGIMEEIGSKIKGAFKSVLDAAS